MTACHVSNNDHCIACEKSHVQYTVNMISVYTQLEVHNYLFGDSPALSPTSRGSLVEEAGIAIVK